MYLFFCIIYGGQLVRLTVYTLCVLLARNLEPVHEKKQTCGLQGLRILFLEVHQFFRFQGAFPVAANSSAMVAIMYQMSVKV